MLRGASANRGGRERDGLRARLAGVLGLLLRHATFIAPTLAGTGARRDLHQTFACALEFISNFLAGHSQS